MEIKQIKDINEVLPILWDFDNDHQKINFPKDSPNYEEFLKRIRKEFEEEPEGFFLIYENGNIIGQLFLKTRYNIYRKQKYGEVRDIHLDQDNRGKGYGKKLLEFSDEYFKKKGCKYALAGVSALNEASNAVFEKSGYERTRIILEKEY